MSLFEALSPSVADLLGGHDPALHYPYSMRSSDILRPRRRAPRTREETLAHLLAVLDSAIETVEGEGALNGSRRRRRPNDKTSNDNGMPTN
jgi:hypothetical protein